MIYEQKINKIKLNQIKTLFKALNSVESFVIKSGNFTLESRTVLAMLSLIGLKDGFTVSYDCATEEEHQYVKNMLDSLNEH